MIIMMEAYGHNRARQREKLGILLEDLGELQTEVGILMATFSIYFLFLYIINDVEDFCKRTDESSKKCHTPLYLNI